MLAVGRIMEYACDKCRDRWHPAMAAYLKAKMLLKNETDGMGDRASRYYKKVTERYVSQNGKQETESAGQTKPTEPSWPSEPPGPATAGNSAASSAKVSHSANGHEPSPEATSVSSGASDSGTAAPSSSSDGQAVAPDAPSVSESVSQSEPVATLPLSARRVAAQSAAPHFRAVPRGLEVGVILLVSLNLTVALVIAAIAILSYATQGSGIAAYVLGGVLADLLATLLPFVLLALAGQVFYTTTSTKAAIVESRGRTWAIEKPGRHLALPFLDQINSFIPVAARRKRCFLRDVPASNGILFSAYVETRYRVVDAFAVWNAVSVSIKHSQLFRMIGQPATDADTGKLIDAHVQSILREVLTNAAREQSQLDLAGIVSLSERVRGILKDGVETSGLSFYTLYMETYIRQELKTDSLKSNAD